MAKKISCIYCVTSPIGRRYVGMTVDYNKRKYNHISNARHYASNTFSKAIRKYGDQLNWKILVRCRFAFLLPFLERFFIVWYNTYRNGYNDSKGGENSLNGVVISDDARIKASKTLTNCSFFAYTKSDLEFVGKWDSYKICGEQLKINPKYIGLCLSYGIKSYSGYYFTVEDQEYVKMNKELIFSSFKSRPKTITEKLLESRRKITPLIRSQRSCDIFYIYTYPNLEFIKEYQVRQFCAKELGVALGRLQLCLGGKISHASKYHFSYLPPDKIDEIKNNISNIRAKLKKKQSKQKIIVTDSDGKENIFLGYKQASISLNIAESTLQFLASTRKTSRKNIQVKSILVA
jgi:hypothetical protein